MGQGVLIEDNHIVNKNPATGEVISHVACTTIQELDEKIAKAKQAAASWADIEASERISLLKKGLAALSGKSNRLQELIVAEMGKPLEQAIEEVEDATSKDEYLTILEASLQPKTHGSSVVVRQPIGSAGILLPWNFPADEAMLLVLPSLASGNTAIVKPSEVAPDTGALLVNTMASFLPPNVLQLAQGDGTVGAHLVAHPDIDMICMTGSTATGKRIKENSGLKRLVLEMGGKDPMMVLADADLDKAAQDAVEYSLSNSGQVCCSVERIYVAESVYDAFQALVTKYSANYKVGNGMEQGVKVGPLVSKMQRDIVARQVEDAVQKGGKILYESDIPKDAHEDASYFPVTVVADVTSEMNIYREETFGPVVSISKFDGSETEAVRLANDTKYGLASSLYSQDLEKAKRIASKIHAGQVGINCYPLNHMNVACPWVGHKNSGIGFHSGEEGFHNFSIPKTLVYES